MLKPVWAISFAFVVAFVLSLGLVARPSLAASPAEQYITDNVQKGLTILNNSQLSKEQRKAQFRDFLMTLTNIKAIGQYTLGQYRRTASPDELASFDTTFKEYALSVYQSYFNKYSGQTLQVAGSYPLNADETVVKTVMNDPKKASQKPLQVDFRVLNTGGRMVVADFSVEGVWIRELERNDFTSYLGQHGGDVKALTQMLQTKSQQFR